MFRTFHRSLGEYAVAVLAWFRGFLRAHALVAVGIFVALFAYYCVLDAPSPIGTPIPTYDVTEVSPDGRYSVVVEAPAADGFRRVIVRSSVDGAVPRRQTTSFLVPGFAVVHWSPDSRQFAVVTANEDATAISGVDTRVLAVRVDGVDRLPLPPGVRPDSLLAAFHPTALLQTASVRFRDWRDTVLVVESTAHGWIGPPGQAASRQAGVQCFFELVAFGREMREIARDC